MTSRPQPPTISTSQQPTLRTTPSPTTPKPAHHPAPISPTSQSSSSSMSDPTIEVTFTEASDQGSNTEQPSDVALGRRGGVCVTEPGSPGPVAVTLDDIKSFYESQ
ncbi:hypothetical protein HK097_001176 [Rhizophlyctis rosea]|uniref:Uncharacterized protein n=1 Tax=Rhizophlyctis rosea TaxID=64517 RepID=A0AAD5SCP5_9FUNG|nr:hypothetical protein HK097_001176 [Rhizophlyctis rosea]